MKELYKIAAQCIQEVYDGNCYNIDSSEYNIFMRTYKKEPILVLAIGGTDERKDWWINFDLRAAEGIKIGAYNEAINIRKHLLEKKMLNKNFRLLVTGHSKGGPSAIAWKRLFGADWCVAFAPARSLRYHIDRNMDNTTLFIDPDDPVTKVGWLFFGHPKCHRIESKDNHILPSISDHMMYHWHQFIDQLE